MSYPSKIFILTGLIVLLLPVVANAQGPAVCNAVLIPDVETAKDNESIRLTFLKTMTRAKFTSMKNSGDAGLKVLVKGVPIGAYADWDQLQTAIDDETNRLESTYSSDRSTDYLKTTLSQTAASAYVRCFELQSFGVFLWVKALTPQQALIVIKWAPPPKHKGVEKIRIQPIGVQSPLPQIDPLWDGAKTDGYFFTRTPNQDLGLSVNLGDFNDSILIPVAPRIAPVSPPPHLRTIHRTYTGLNPSTICLPDRIPWRTPITLSMAGFWNGVPSGEDFNGPLAGTRAKVFARSAVTKNELSRSDYQDPAVFDFNYNYQHPSTFTPKVDFEICVKLSERDPQVNIRSTDPVNISVGDVRP